jgi:GT2 family glycosyltransferase
LKLSVIIVNYNVKYFLQQCLQSVQNACRTVDAEIFVVDNNSSDGSNEMVQLLFPEVHLIANKDNTGFSKANNQAIRKSKGEYVLLLNPDTVVEEDTFKKVVDFMDAHDDAGGLGVYMIDGKGNFLPESKRGLPTPSVAFYKIFGLSSLFPKSKAFGKYHLGYLDKNKTHEVDVLSGAFMLMRKATLDKVGLLDEDYFMYGEDIDLSYRITKGGYKNYYFADTKIIHYKGESTKKSSVNYVFVFYKAMVIFAKKHFAPGNAALFSFLINMAIWLRAGLAIVKRFIDRIWLPLVDGGLIYLGMMAIKDYWSINVNVAHYPPFFMNVVVPIYIGIWILSAYLNGGYDKPFRFSKLITGLLIGTLVILVGYALLPENLRFSRALILFGTAWACFIAAAIRILLHYTKIKTFHLNEAAQKRLLIVGDAGEVNRILSMLMIGGNTNRFIGFISNSEDTNEQQNLKSFYLGSLSSFSDIVSVYEINEVIFCGKDLPSSQIMNLMSSVSNSHIEFKIAPPESMFIIGSNSINENGDLYFVDVSNLNSPANKRKKRIFDVCVSIAFLILSPILILIVKNHVNFLINIFQVLAGVKSWVGKRGDEKILRGLKPGVLSPASMSTNNDNEVTKDRLNALYAKEFNWRNDWRIVLKNIKKVGS